MKNRALEKVGIPRACAPAARDVLRAAAEAGRAASEVVSDLARVAASAKDYVDDEVYGTLARTLVEQARATSAFAPRAMAAPWRQWGDDVEPAAVQQLKNACQLPVSVSAALMPDAHVGYGLPIGGVLATRDAVIPYAVGVDIACRMKLTVLDLPTATLADGKDRLAHALHEETRFGIGASFKARRLHDVMDEDWRVTPVTATMKDKAWSQLGTSGSGNHFVEFGQLDVLDAGVGLPPGEYLALLSHSGSRGSGAQVAEHYSKLAQKQHRELPRELSHLAWLDLASEAGQEYWAAMELMGRYAAANHALIHRHIARALGVEVLLDVENHHNFAWRERHAMPDGAEAEVIVHRKGATPAGAGVLGVIPGSMGAPGYVVRGKGKADSLNSAAHGAGRRMSRTQAKATFKWESVQRFLRERNVTLLSAGLDEVPMAYKNIDEVMAAQADLVEPLARFSPRIVKMAPSGERPED
jgi:tRNA-splicing ligase RtcB